jgi:hypothetical protein
MPNDKNISWWVVFFDPTNTRTKAQILKLNTINFDKINRLLVAKKEVGVTASIIAFDPRINRPAFIDSVKHARELGLYPENDEDVLIAPKREEMKWLGKSMITFGDNQCFGYLMDFGERGVFSATHGRVDVTPQEARINNLAYEEAELDGFDNNCEVGHWGRFYLKREGKGDRSLFITTFLGTIVSGLVEEKKRKIVFRRGDKIFEGKRDKDSSLINFKRIK